MGRHGTERRDLQNRRLQVRFLSHLPFGVLNSWGLLPHCAHPLLHALTPFDPNAVNRSLTNYARLVIEVLVQQRLQRLCPVNSNLAAPLIIPDQTKGAGQASVSSSATSTSPW